MTWEYSCGGVVFTRKNGVPHYVLVQEAPGKYSFPKGHMEGDETEEETARREIFEETGLKPVFIPGFCVQDAYALAEKPGVSKRVTYFLAEYGDEAPIPREGEIEAIEVLPYEDAVKRFPKGNNAKILAEAKAFLEK